MRTVLTAQDGKWLCNRPECIIASTVYLAEGRDADAAEWAEISDAEKQQLEAEWAAEAETT